MRDEVEEFLRRVAQMRAQAEAQARAAQQRPGAPQQQQQQRMPPHRMPPQQEVVYLEPAEVEIIDAELAEQTRSIGSTFAGAQQISDHARQLGEEVDLADDKLEARLHQTFDHQVGHLKDSASRTAAEPHAAPQVDVTTPELLKLLRNTESIRDAIVVSEVLRRPEERWQ